jgi:hypothetical protein
MVAAYDVSDEGACVSDRAPRACGNARSKKQAPRSLAAPDELLPLTVPEVRHLLWGLVWRKVPTPEQVVRGSLWRRTHQAHAKRAHYKRTAAQHNQLQL